MTARSGTLHSSATDRLGFKVEATDPASQARAASFRTSHGPVETPIFMPVATRAALRGIDAALVDQLGYQVLLANTYHLLLRPGPDVFRQFGGIHSFMQWPNSVLTDSGGYQIFSLARHLRLTEEGARFRSYIDGSEVVLTPESSIATQRAIGSDIMMVLDHCIDSTSDRTTTQQALELTTRWAKRSFAARPSDSSQAMFGIVQGACFPELRRESAAQICEIPFDGFAMGGLAVGETKAEREDIVEGTAPLLPADKPRYLMGVGTPIDLLEAVKRGVDMFDCILPTALAQQGVCFTSTGKVDLKRGLFKSCNEPLDRKCQCSTCARFSRAYLNHLVRSGEFLAHQLCAIHNLTFYRQLMADMRIAICAGSFGEFYRSNRASLVAEEPEYAAVPPKMRRRPDLTRLGDYQVLIHPSGYGSIKQITSGEVMHSVVEPKLEALQLYIEQPGLVQMAQTEGDALVIWDVGLGAATNAMTLVMELERQAALRRPVSIISFERDLDPLRLALKHPGPFEHLRHAAPHHIVERGVWRNDRLAITWSLLPGDVREKISEAAAPDVIWYDPFSYKVNSELWGTSAFEMLLRACSTACTRLYTYTASTAVRSAMLAAGWYVGAGVATGPKRETTAAYNERAVREYGPLNLLGDAWRNRWERSDAKQPLGASSDDLLQKIRSHPQFNLMDARQPVT